MLHSSILWILLLGSAATMLALIALADREGSVTAPPEAASRDIGGQMRPRGAWLDQRVQPLHVRHGSPDAPRTQTFAFSLRKDGMLLTGPPELRVNDVVYLEAGREQEPVQAAALVVGETPRGYKDVRFERTSPHAR